jgi:outer membrane protein OmpA-like peptidoglycan-associated protein
LIYSSEQEPFINYYYANKTREDAMKKLVVIILLSLPLTSGCAMETKTQKGGAYGAAGGAVAGALLGQAIGRDTEGTLWGAAIGAALGGATGAGVGRMMDNQERDMRAALAASEDAAVRREGDLLAITLKGDVTFDTNSTTVKPGLYQELDRIGGIMVQYPETLIRVEGHTDNVGSDSFNQDLSERRAASVRDQLVKRGVDYNRMQVVGFGESMPVATNDTEAGRQMNRRVELKVAPKNY